MSIEAAIAELTEAVKANTAVCEQLLAGRDQAVEALKAKAEGETKPTRRRSSRKTETETTGNASGDNADTGYQAGAAGSASDSTASTVSDDDLRNAATSYIQGAGDDKAARAARGANIKSITDHFGTKTLVGETGITDAEQRTQALFYLNRFAVGCDVDFSAEYDFAGDPAQGGGSDDADCIG